MSSRFGSVHDGDGEMVATMGVHRTLYSTGYSGIVYVVDQLLIVDC